MYYYKRAQREVPNKPDLFKDPFTSDECFSKKVKGWLVILSVVVFAVIVMSIKEFTQNHPSSKPAESDTEISAQKVAYSPCPYCRGMLDSQGRCNIRECPLYDPNWGKVETVRVKRSKSKPTLFKELAMEVTPYDYGNGVTVHSVYGKGNAEKAGLMPQDLIIGFNGRKIKSLKNFSKAVSLAAPESKVEVVFLRNEQKKVTTIAVGEGEMEGVVIPQPVAWGTCPGVRR